MIAFSKSRLATRKRLASLESYGKPAPNGSTSSSRSPSSGAIDFSWGQSAHDRALPSPRGRSALWHVGGVIPGEQGGRSTQVVDLPQAALQLRKLGLCRSVVVTTPAGHGSSSRGVAACGPSGLAHVRLASMSFSPYDAEIVVGSVVPWGRGEPRQGSAWKSLWHECAHEHARLELRSMEI